MKQIKNWDFEKNILNLLVFENIRSFKCMELNLFCTHIEFVLIRKKHKLQISGDVERFKRFKYVTRKLRQTLTIKKKTQFDI